MHMHIVGKDLVVKEAGSVGVGTDRGGKASVSATCISGCTDGVCIVADGGMGVSVGMDGVGAVADRGTAHAQACTFAVADIASGFAHLPDCSPPA
jgi:hypothetical protein